MNSLCLMQYVDRMQKCFQSTAVARDHRLCFFNDIRFYFCSLRSSSQRGNEHQHSKHRLHLRSKHGKILQLFMIFNFGHYQNISNSPSLWTISRKDQPRYDPSLASHPRTLPVVLLDWMTETKMLLQEVCGDGQKYYTEFLKKSSVYSCFLTHTLPNTTQCAENTARTVSFFSGTHLRVIRNVGWLMKNAIWLLSWVMTSFCLLVFSLFHSAWHNHS